MRERERDSPGGAKTSSGVLPIILLPTLSPLHSLAKKNNKISHMKRNEAENVVKEKRNVNDLKIVKIGKWKKCRIGVVCVAGGEL